jgi:spermidine synthase
MTDMPDRTRTVYLLIVIVVCGGLVMALEILGTRIIGTFYGSSLYVWGSLITVTLISLALGYYLGGLLADKFPREWVLYSFLLLASISIFVILFTKGVLPVCYKLFGLAMGTLVSSFLIFTFPLTLLGIVTPFAVRLRAISVEKVGKTAGGVSALSTIGSVIGTISVSFFIIPHIGTRLAITGIGVLLLLLSVIGLTLERGIKCILFLLLIIIPLLSPQKRLNVVYSGESLYSRLIVLDKDDQRCLLIDGILQTGKPKNIHTVSKATLLKQANYYLELLPYFNPEGEKALLIGLAGGLLPYILSMHDIETKAVEIDPRITYLAKKYFDYQGEVTIGDGRRYVEDSKEKFDFCILDAYSSDQLPFHMVTVQMFEAVSKRLKKDGILAINYIGSPLGRGLGSIHKTIHRVFKHLKIYGTKDDDSVQTIYLFASNEPLELLPLWREGADTGVDQLSYNLQTREIDPKKLTGVVLTDGYNPIDIIRSHTSLRWREKSIERFGPYIISY